MKRCGMVTMYDDNFGTCLQAYSLQVVLSHMNIVPEIIRYNRKDMPIQESVFAKIMVKIKNIGVINLFRYILSYKFIQGRKQAFEQFRTIKLKLSEQQYYRNSKLETLENLYDIFVCGSDMLWSEEFVKDWKFYFLEFVSNKKTIAYAPSFGKNEISEKYQNFCKKLLKNIEFLSCRENAGVRLIQELSELRIPQVLDPTMLLTRNDWNAVIDNNSRMVSEPYILMYLFGGTDGNRKKFFETMQKELTIRNVFVPMTYEQYNAETLPDIGPLEYLRLFRDAEFVVTDTFHGLMFSIIFRKPFLVLERDDQNHWGKYSERMTSTLEMLGLEERYVNYSFHDFQSMKYLDYSSLDDILEEKRQYSLEYLKKSLEDERHWDDK